MILKEHDGMILGIFPPLEIIAPELLMVTTTRVGGVSTGPYRSLNLGSKTGDRLQQVRKNRALLLDSLSIPSRRLARAEQVHGAGIAIVTRPGVSGGADGLITEKKETALVISTADCYPVVIYAPSEKVLAALHVGRKGAAKGIIQDALEMMQNRFTIDIDHAIALIGPGICRRCYTVWKRTAGRFPDKAVRLRKERWHLDLNAFCKMELSRCGIKRKNIFSADICTSCRSDLYYSHKRDRGITGRHWTIAAIT